MKPEMGTLLFRTVVPQRIIVVTGREGVIFYRNRTTIVFLQNTLKVCVWGGKHPVLFGEVYCVIANYFHYFSKGNEGKCV